jgi:hypothetical protein
MARTIEPAIPDPIIREIGKRPPSALAIPLVSLDSEGFPHLAMLSYFETVYWEKALHFFIRRESGTSRNLSLRPQCALIFADDGHLYYLKGRVSLKATISDQAVFQFNLTAALEDSSGPDEGKALIRSGIRFERDAKIDDQRLALRDRVEASLQGLS